MKPSGSKSAMALGWCLWIRKWPDADLDKNASKGAIWKQICNGFGKVYLGAKISLSRSGQKGVQMKPDGSKSVFAFRQCIWNRERLEQVWDRKAPK